jgi:hypothetical protein
MVEIVTTKQKRVAFCNICAYEWPYEADVCVCEAVPLPHFHQATRPDCPKCGKPAQLARPA